MVITDANSLLQFLMGSEYADRIKEYIDQRAFTIHNYEGFIDTLRDALREVAGESVTEEQLRGVEFDTYRELFPSISIGLYNASLGETPSEEVTRNKSFWTDFSTNATDPFRGIQNYVDRFNKQYKQLTERRVSSVSDLVSDTNSRLTSLPSYQAGNLKQGLEAATEHGARRLIASMPSIKESLDRQIKDYANPSGFVMRPTGLDVYSMLNSEENKELGFRGFVFQFQSTNAIAGVLERTGPTVVGTQGYTGTLKDGSQPDVAASILVGNDLSIRTAELYKPGRIKPVYQDEGSVHAKIGYFYGQEKDGVVKEEGPSEIGLINKVVISTQNWTSTLDRSTTVEEMLLLNRKDARSQTAFDILARQSKAAVDALLELTNNKLSSSTTQKDFKGQYESKLGVFKDEPAKILFVNNEIHKQIAGKLKDAYESQDRAALSIQYIENVLNPEKGANQELMPFGMQRKDGKLVVGAGFEALENLASEGRLSIAITATSHGQDQGLFKLLDAYKRIEEKDISLRTEVEQRKYSLIKTMLEKGAFTMMPSQFMHSKSFAILGQNNQLKAYGAGSANLSTYAHEKNIEVMAIFDSVVRGTEDDQFRTLDALDKQTEDDIQQAYLYGYSRFHLEDRTQYQGLLIEQRGKDKEKIAKLGYDYLAAMGGVEASSWDDPAAKGKKFIYSKRYLVGKGDASAVGATIQIASPIAGQAGYSFAVTFGGEQVMHGKGPDGMQPVVYLNKSQRLIAGMVYKNASGSSKVYNVFDLQGETGQLQQRALEHGDSYQANAFDVLGGLIETTYYAMRYEHQVRGLYAAYGMAEKDTFEGSLRRYVGVLMGKSLEGSGLNLKSLKGTNDLYAVASDFVESINGEPKRKVNQLFNTLQQQLTKHLGTSVEQYNTFRPVMAKTAAMDDQRMTFMNEQVHRLLEGLKTIQQSGQITPDAVKAQVDAFTKAVTAEVNRSLNFGNFAPGQNHFTGLYNDLVMQAIDLTPSLKDIYRSEIELGKREAFSNMVVIFSQPPETGFSFGQGFHRLPVYGEDQYINNAYSILRSGDAGAFIMSPYALMHGEALGQYSGQYLRAVASSGRLKLQDPYTRYGGLLKLEGGAPAVHELESLMKSMPGLDVVRKEEYITEIESFLKKDIEVDGETIAGLSDEEANKIATQLAEETFSRYRDQRLEAKRLGEEYNEDDETLYFFPFAKSEQISQRMKNLTSTRPIFNASAEFVKYAMSLGAVKGYDSSNSKLSLGGNVLATLTAQQYKALTQEYLRRYRKTHPTDNSADKELLDKVDTALLREIAQELTVDQKQLTKGFLGGYAPRRIVIVDGASQLSDSGLLNAGLKDNGNTIKYVQPHVVQATSTLDSFIASPAKLNQVVQKQLRPGTIFLARDLKIEENDIVTQLNKKLNANVQTALEAAGSVVTQMPESTKGTFNLTAYIDTVSSLSGLDAPIAKQLVLNALKDLKKEFKNIKIEYGRDRENIEFYYAKGVYSPADSKTLDDGDSGKIQYIEGLSKIGEIVGSEIGQGLSVTINDLFQYSSVTGDGRARPITFSIPAVSALELGPAISVLSEALLTVSGGNTVILDLDLQTLKDFKEGMRGGLDTAKGPMRTAEETFWTTVKTFTESTQKLLPKRVAAQEVFAMLSSSQIKGFNFGMGLGLLEEKEQSGIYQLIKQSDSKDKAGGGRAVAEALAMFLLTRSDLEDVSGLRGVLATSLETFTYKDGRSRTQYAEALQIRNRAKPNEKGKQLKGIDKDLSSSLDYFGQLAALVDPSRMLGKTLQEALSEQVTLALQGDDRALKQLQTGTLKLFGRAFEDSFKSGDGVHTLLDDFSSRPAGLLAFLIKASQDVFQNVDVKERLSKAGLAEVSLDKQSVFTQDYSTDATADGYLRKLSSVVSPGTSYAGKIKSTLIKHEITELIRNISELNSGDITRYRANDQSLSIDNVEAYLAKLAEVKGATGTERLRLQKEANVLGAKLGTTGFNMDSLESMLKLGYHPIVEAYKESTGRADFENFIKLEPSVAAAELKAFIAIGNAAKVEGKLRQSRLPEFTATQSNIEEIQKLTGNKLSLETVYELIELYGKDGESRLLNTAKDSNLATYTALELYGRFGELGRKLGTGIEEIASRFGYSLPDSDEIKRILQKLKDNNTITAEEELKLKEVEAVYGAVRTYLQTQRMIELPGEYTPGKLTVPTGMKNITALEGHYAQGLTKKQLEMYTYNPKNEHDVGTIQQALVSLAMIYEGAVPSQRRVQAKYGLQMHNVTDSAIVQHLIQKEEPTLASVGYQKDTTSMLLQYKNQRLLGTQEQTEKGLAFEKLTNQATADEFVATFLTHYTGFAKHNLPGSINRLGELETRSIGESAVHQFIDIGGQYLNEKDLLPDIEAMVKYAHLTRHNLGDNLSYEDNINRRVDLIIQEAETGLTIKLQKGYTINVVNAIIKRANEERVTLGDDFDMQRFLDTIYKSNESVAIDNNQVVKLRDLSLEEKQLQRSIINAKVEAPTESTQNVLRIGIKNYAETLRPTIQQRVINTFRTDTGAEYLEGMELLYKSALQQADYYSKMLGDTELSDYDRGLANNQLGRAEALQRSLKTSRFVSLPSLVVIDQHSVNEQGEFTGKNVVTIGAERSAQTGVVLGLDILQKMSLLFNAESHPALEAQFSLVAKLQKTQHLINRIQFNALNNKNTDISDEELKDLQELPLLMHHTKQTTIDLIHNKNSIRQATANRLGMSGTSYIAVNSFLVGMDEVGLGDRINRAAGTDSGNGMSRLASSIDKDLRKQAESFKLITAGGFRGQVMYEMTVLSETDKLRSFLENLNPASTAAKDAERILSKLNELRTESDNEVIINTLVELKEFIAKQSSSQEQLTRRLTEVESLLSYAKDKLTIQTHEKQLDRLLSNLDAKTAEELAQQQSFLDSNRTNYEAAQDNISRLSIAQIQAYNTQIAERVTNAEIQPVLNSNGEVIESEERQVVRLLQQEQDIYDNYPDIAKFTKQLSGWANLLKDYAHKFNNPNAQLITEQDLFARLMRNESLDYIVVASITGREWDKNELQKGIEQVESIIGIGAVMTGRQGAPFGTSSPPSGHALNAMAKQGIYITEVNRRARELNSYLVSDESSASTLMLISAFGFEFTGLGDYDGDSFQAALTKINEATGTISEATVKIKRLERQLESVKREIDRYGTDTYQTGELKRQEAAIESELNNTKQAKTKAEQLVQHNKDEIARHQEGRTTHAYEGLRSYIGSYVALPEQVVGDRQISELTVFRDEALRGTVKQYRDTLGGFNWDTGLQRGEIGNYVYATALEFDNDNKLKNVTFSKYIEDLGERRSGKIAEDFKFWSSQFEQSSRYTAFLAEHGNKLEAKDREDYIQEVSAYQAEMESTVMSMFTMKKILGNVTGTTIDPSNLGSMQAIMGTTGGSLLGKVYNTVVPISAGLAANTSFNRMLLDPDLVGRFNQSVEAGFENVIGGNTNVEVVAALTSVKEMLTQTAVSGQTTEIIPWRIAQRQTEESSGVMYRFLLTAQQYLRDSALKPKQAGGLVGRIREYTVTEAAIEQLKTAGINEEESLKDLTGYDEIIRRERQFTNNEQKAKYIQIISQDFLGTVANEALQYNYGSAVRGESVAETEGLTAFAALRLLTDYIGGTGNSAANLMESSTYSKTLQGIKARYENELKEKTLSEDLQRRLVSAGKIDDSKLVNYVLTDMLNKFQSQFIVKANLENTDFIKIQETEAALKLYGLDDKGSIKDSGALQFAAMEDYVKDVQSYLDINTGVDSEDSKLFSAEAYAILNGIQNPDASREERMALVEEKAKDRLNTKYNDAQTEAQIEGRLKERQAQVEADMKAQRAAIQAAIKEETARNEGNTLSDGQLTKAVFTGLIENRISSQTEALMPALENLRAFNQAVNEVASSGKTSKLSKALLDQQSTYSALAMEFQAQQYALDSGKLVGESLPKAFSQTVLNIVDAIQEREGTPNASGKLVMTDSEMKAVMAAMALGGALPQNVLPMVEAATQGLSQENKNEFQLKLIKALTTQGGALEQVANANAYQTAQLGMSGLKNTLTDMLTEETKKLESMEAGTAEAEIQIKKIEELTKANQITQKEFNQNYDEYIIQQEERKSQQEGFISPKTNIERMLDTIAEQSARSNELVRATTQRAELHQQLRQTHTLAEGISILAVPLLFSAMQGDIMTSKEQLTSLGADILQSAVMSNSYEKSALRNFISPTTDSAALKRMANIGDKFQFGRMQQFLMNYESPTEGLARAALSELVYSGAAMTGSLLGQAIDTRRDELAGMPGVSGQTGTGRVITEIAGGVIGMAVGGVVSQRPLPETTVTQDEFMADVVKGMVQSYQNIQNYLSQNLLGNEDEDMEVMDPDSNEPIALGLSQGDIRPTATGTNVAALSVQEYLQVISEDTDSPTTAQLLGLA